MRWFFCRPFGPPGENWKWIKCKKALNPRSSGGLSHLRHGGGWGAKWPHLLQKVRGIKRRRNNFLIALNEYFRKYFVIFSLRSILRSPKVTKGQICRNVILFLRKCAIISESVIGSRLRKKTLDSPFKALSLTCNQNWPNINGLGYRGQERSK